VAERNPEEWSADVLSFFVPSQIQTIGTFFQNLTKHFIGNASENNNYIGYGALFFAGVAVWKYRKKMLVRFLAGATIIFGILALGPHVHFAGAISIIPLPYILLYKHIPGFSLTGVPTRFTALVIFCISILAAIGLTYLLKRSKNIRKRLILMTIVSTFLVLELAAFPFTVTHYPVSSFYYDLAKEPGDFAIIDLHENYTKPLYFQTIHGKKMVDGYISRKTTMSQAFLNATPVIAELTGKKEITVSTPDAFIAQEILRDMDVKYVVLENGMDAEIVETFGLKRVYEDELVWVYEVD